MFSWCYNDLKLKKLCALWIHVKDICYDYVQVKKYMCFGV